MSRKMGKFPLCFLADRSHWKIANKKIEITSNWKISNAFFSVVGAGYTWENRRQKSRGLRAIHGWGL